MDEMAEVLQKMGAKARLSRSFNMEPRSFGLTCCIFRICLLNIHIYIHIYGPESKRAIRFAGSAV